MPASQSTSNIATRSVSVPSSSRVPASSKRLRSGSTCSEPPGGANGCSSGASVVADTNRSGTTTTPNPGRSASGAGWMPGTRPLVSAWSIGTTLYRSPSLTRAAPLTRRIASSIAGRSALATGWLVWTVIVPLTPGSIT